MSTIDRRSLHDRALFKRLVISHFDLTGARQFLSRLRGENGETVPQSSDTIQRDALMTALIVGYGRPFSDNRRGDVSSRLPDRFLDGLTPEQRSLHERILELRNQEFAHSDPEPADVSVTVVAWSDGTPLTVPMSNRTRLGLSDDQLRELSNIFAHLLRAVFDEMERIRHSLMPGDAF